jgi:hypothetical protein
MSEPVIGSREWWLVAHLFSLRGPVDSVLRLLEQQEITRGKARELLFYAARVTGGFWMKPAPQETPPDAPWDKLNWCGDAVPERKGDAVVWLDDYENDAIDPQDGESPPIDIWWEDMRPQEVRRMAKEAYERGRRTGPAAMKLARIGEAMRKLVALCRSHESAATALLLPMAARILEEIES